MVLGNQRQIESKTTQSAKSVLTCAIGIRGFCFSIVANHAYIDPLQACIDLLETYIVSD